MKHLAEESWFRWKCDDPAVIEIWCPELKLERSLTFIDMDKRLYRHFPLKSQLVMRLIPWLVRRRIEGYRMCVFSRRDFSSV